MSPTLTTASRLALNQTAVSDLKDFVKLCSDSRVHESPLSLPDLEEQIVRLFVLASALRGSGGGMWSVRDSAHELIGCALVVRWAHPSDREISVALGHKHWGEGYAMDIARALTANQGPLHWTATAESFEHDRPPRLSRVTFDDLLSLSLWPTELIARPTPFKPVLVKSSAQPDAGRRRSDT